MTKRIVSFIALVLISLVPLMPKEVLSQDASPRVIKAAPNDAQALTDDDIQMLRKDIRSQRKQIIAANMPLSDAEAEKFWPVYEQFVSDLVKINGTKYALIKQYVQTKGALSDTEAATAVDQWVSVDQSVAELRKKYVPEFRKVLSPKNTALFYQLDRRVQLMIDLQLASSLPLIEP